MAHLLSEIAAYVGGRLERGDGASVVDHVATLTGAESGAISFLANPKYRRQLAATRATAVLLTEPDSARCPVASIVCRDPYLAFAKVAALLNPVARVVGGIHPSAVVSESAQVDETAWVGPGSIIGDRVVIGPGVSVGPSCVLEPDSVVGHDSRLVARVTLCHGTILGARVLVHPGAVIGSDGFGLANDAGAWVKVPQLGRARVGDDVEIGANTTIDRGAIEDTVIGDGVKLDNQIQIAHNVEIGEHTAIAACVGISGSTRVGRHCLIGGGVGLAGHLEIGDRVQLTGQSLVTRSFREPGAYSGNLPAIPNGEWRRNVVRFRHLDELADRLKRLEREVFSESAAGRADVADFDDGQ